MTDTKGFDPQVFVDQPETLADTADAADAAVLKYQRALHRQRLGSAQKALVRAQEADDTAEVARQTQRVSDRAQRLARAEEHFAVANVAKPVLASKQAQVLVVVIGEAKAPPLTAALLADGNKIIAEEPVLPSGGAVFSFADDRSGLRLQISDSDGQVLFRDADSFDVALGQVAERAARLTGKITDPSPAPETISMPDLTGLSEEAACAILTRLGVRDIDIKRRASDGPVGIVIEHSPAAGQELKPEAGAGLVISQRGDGPDPDDQELIMPNFVGQPIEAVQKAARAEELKLGIEEANSEKPDGLVIGQDPDPGKVLQAPFVATVTVSIGQDTPDVETVVVPDLVGLQAEEAKRIADDLKIALTLVELQSGRPKNEVIGQTPPADTIAPHPVTMRLTVSTGNEDIGPNVIRIPDFIGQNIDRVVVIAERLGITLDIRRVQDGGETGVVSAQAPKPGEEVTLPAKMRVDVSVGRTEEPGVDKFQGDLVRLAQQDARFAGLNLPPDRLAQGLEGVTKREDVERILAANNATIATRFGFSNRNLSRTLRSILRQALSSLG